MARNICIFSDGTGQAGGANPINWTHVYRLFKATREIDPPRQICFYDPGLGSSPDAGETRGLFRRVKDALAQATGYGITDNIVDCYTALLLSYRPGDTVYLFGFSRGAYTVRSLGGALGLCGIPPGLPKLERWDEFEAQIHGDVRDIAKEAVTKVYQERDAGMRAAAAAAFRTKYGSQELPPHFIGVWDTVKALGIKGISDLLPGRHSFNNDLLNPKVAHGRQALSIDENRKTFKPEIWDERGAPPRQIEQRWFSGVHTDIGGGYGLAMGLSDITLTWMLDAATMIDPPLLVDPLLVAELRPDHRGIQHDELQSGVLPWMPGTRENFVTNAYFGSPGKPSVEVDPRFREPKVPILDEERPYRPVAMRQHPDFQHYY
ncbi:DUF2235 domain-containing protein [Bosea sp. PAMC 26642]|uniref:DUF2235 domain-containing protein n=1 Tax=Bosea sp. (strain PAMC 26642) TaxID=1792307 RepID=UPI0009E84F14|nr:DUF2235 domain-containing protein [Bosea sp. PAMC 26642]